MLRWRPMSTCPRIHEGPPVLLCVDGQPIIAGYDDNRDQHYPKPFWDQMLDGSTYIIAAFDGDPSITGWSPIPEEGP